VEAVVSSIITFPGSIQMVLFEFNKIELWPPFPSIISFINSKITNILGHNLSIDHNVYATCQSKIPKFKCCNGLHTVVKERKKMMRSHMSFWSSINFQTEAETT